MIIHFTYSLTILCNRYVDSLDAAMADDVSAVVAMAQCNAAHDWNKALMGSGKLFIAITRKSLFGVGHITLLSKILEGYLSVIIRLVHMVN